MDLIRISFDRRLRASSSWSLCRSLTSSNRKLCTCKLVQVQSFIIASQHLRITLMMSLSILIGHVNVQSWHRNSVPSIIVYFLCTLAFLLLPKKILYQLKFFYLKRKLINTFIVLTTPTLPFDHLLEMMFQLSREFWDCSLVFGVVQWFKTVVSNLLIMIRVLKSKLVLTLSVTHHWGWVRMESLKASTLLVRFPKLPWPLHCDKFLIVVPYVCRPTCGSTLKLIEASYASLAGHFRSL